jgi:hypothetical protein
VGGSWVQLPYLSYNEGTTRKGSTMKLPHLTLTVSHPILHDIIKAHLVYNYREIFGLCSTLPQLRQSRIYKPDTPHKLEDSRQEWFVDGIRYPADAVWRFRAYDTMFPSYYIVHEIKTGHYSIEEEMKKHYIHNNHVSFYIWAYPEYHKENSYKPYSFVKMLDITKLKDYVIPSTTRLMEEWGWSCG